MWIFGIICGVVAVEVWSKVHPSSHTAFRNLLTGWMK